MDFNDLTKRLERTYASIGLMSSADYQSKIDWTSGELDIRFGSKDVSEDESKVVSIISSIADLKDNLKNKMTSLGLDKNLVEIEIDNSLYLQLITDLDNQHKHGYPARQRRSKMDPEIKNVTSNVSFSMGTAEAGVTFDLINQEVTTRGGMKGEVVLNADILDYGGNFICTLDKMVNEAMTTWEKFIRTHGLK